MIKLCRSINIGITGVVSTARSEVNMRWHLLATVLAVLAGFVCEISYVEWALISGCIGAVLALECLNTAIEHLADRVTTERDPLIGLAKDASAGAVLLMSLATAVIAGLVFLPHLVEMLQ
ncbi:MAG: diacylglycerol kinase [Verrucomicrobiales bacterium]|jgi:diacylglycerol kinase